MDYDFQDDASSSQPDIPWSRTQIGRSAAHAEASEDDDGEEGDASVEDGSDSADKSDDIAGASTSDEE